MKNSEIDNETANISTLYKKQQFIHNVNSDR